MISPTDRLFVGMAAAALDDYLARNPLHATAIGDHRFDARLPDMSPDGVTEQVRVLSRHLTALDSVDPRELSRVNLVDLGILRDRLDARVFELRTLAQHTWNPLTWNPGEALYPLIARPGGDPAARSRALRARVEGIPEYLDLARSTLAEMPAIHVGVAIEQTRGWKTMLADLDLGSEHSLIMDEAMSAAAEHERWLRVRLRGEHRRSPRLGEELYSESLGHILGSPGGAQADIDLLLSAARGRLAELREEINSAASRYLNRSMAARGIVSDALGRVADESRLVPHHLRDVAQRALNSARSFTLEQKLMTVPDIDIRIIDMPEFRRGVSIAYCDAPGAAEREHLPTFLAVAPPPPHWSAARTDSFYREYNEAMLDNLMVHEGIPGHALQLAHAARGDAVTQVRAVFPSGVFIEGWAGYAERLLQASGYHGSDPSRDPLALRLQQLKMAIRCAVNTVLDVSYHARGMTEPEARRLLAVEGLQTEAEVVSKWQRVQLTHGQLTTYFVGGEAVAELIAGVQSDHPRWSPRRIHDSVLRHGSVDPGRLGPLVTAAA